MDSLRFPSLVGATFKMSFPWSASRPSSWYSKVSKPTLLVKRSSAPNPRSDLVGLPLDPPNLREVEESCIGVPELGQLVHDLLRRAPDLDHVHPLEVGRGTEFHPHPQRQAPLQPVAPLL